MVSLRWGVHGHLEFNSPERNPLNRKIELLTQDNLISISPPPLTPSNHEGSLLERCRHPCLHQEESSGLSLHRRVRHRMLSRDKGRRSASHSPTRTGGCISSLILEKHRRNNAEEWAQRNCNLVKATSPRSVSATRNRFRRESHCLGVR